MKNKRFKQKDKIRAAARRLHALWWFEEAADKEIMIREWNRLYPSAKISTRKMLKEMGI